VNIKIMRTWKEILENLKDAPMGYSADGGTLGLGLANALARSRKQQVAEVEAYMRSRSLSEPQVTASK
jgi:hypothetical protein